MEKGGAVAPSTDLDNPLDTDKALYSFQQIRALITSMLVQIQLSPCVHWKMRVTQFTMMKERRF